ncbi:MAG: transposase [Candidatus Neptunochlamydia sp.]|nr:transposase [Candidatus Neptunochlamydia sp.]
MRKQQRGGFSSKVHVKVDAFGLPLAYKVTGGNRHEITQAENLMGKYKCEFLIADGGYDSNEFRKENVEPVIPGRVSRKERIEIDRYLL